jgi:hypothetical protein
VCERGYVAGERDRTEPAMHFKWSGAPMGDVKTLYNTVVIPITEKLNILQTMQGLSNEQ